ncbi:MAG: hypothetical protein LQ346_005470 [Caloplaca aetnensis]|nr:MAG: hypothetical protein LQ346_005470 [Caloplaca aetnensis]
MPILDANSEAFLNFFKGIQKGKGKENASFESSEALFGPKFTADDWKSPATVTKDFAAASEGLEEPASNGKAENVGVTATSPNSQEPESEEKTNNVGFEESGTASPGLAENAAAHAAYGHTSTNDPTDTNSAANGTPGDEKPAVFASESFAPPTAAAEPLVNEANYYATTSNDPTVSGLQIITRSMTASGGDTTQVNTSAATEKATTSWLPSPGPATPEVSTPRAEAWPPGLVSSGSEFLKALPMASDAFKARMRGGVNSIEEENDPTTPISATFASNHGITTHASGFYQSPEASLASFQEYALPNPEEAGSNRDLPTSYELSTSTNASFKQPEADASSLLLPGQEDFSGMWGVKNTRRDRAASMDKPASFTNASYPEQPNTGRASLLAPGQPAYSAKGTPRFYPRGVRYTEAELLEIGLEKKLGLLEELVEFGGKGRVRVGIMVE